MVETVEMHEALTMPEDHGGKVAVAEYFLRPGFIYVPAVPTLISAVLGSAVSVCLYDKKNGVAGMNHFLFPEETAPGKTTALYGNVATMALIRMVRQHGAGTRYLEAQIFGGARNHEQDQQRDVGRENVEMARRTLRGKQICIVSEDVGGQRGRKVIFHCGKFESVVLKVERLRKGDWYPYESDR
jgi:chemotaxis protein CheD